MVFKCGLEVLDRFFPKLFLTELGNLQPQRPQSLDSVHDLLPDRVCPPDHGRSPRIDGHGAVGGHLGGPSARLPMRWATTASLIGIFAVGSPSTVTSTGFDSMPLAIIVSFIGPVSVTQTTVKFVETTTEPVATATRTVRRDRDRSPRTVRHLTTGRSGRLQVTTERRLKGPARVHPWAGPSASETGVKCRAATRTGRHGKIAKVSLLTLKMRGRFRSRLHRLRNLRRMVSTRSMLILVVFFFEHEKVSAAVEEGQQVFGFVTAFDGSLLIIFFRSFLFCSFGC